MKVLTEGHKYELDNFENDNRTGQTIQFIEKTLITQESHPELFTEDREPEAGTLYTVHNGTTNEDLLAVLINRMKYLDNKFASPENKAATKHLESALEYMEARTKGRVKRGVEGKALA